MVNPSFLFLALLVAFVPKLLSEDNSLRLQRAGSFYATASIETGKLPPAMHDSVEIDGIEFAFSGPASWVTESAPELGGATAYKALSPATEQNRSFMTAEVIGPAFIEYFAVQKSGSYDLGGLYVDDTSIHRYYSAEGWRKYSYQLDEGIHKVEFVIDDFHFHLVGESPLKFAGIKIVSGYQLKVSHLGGTLSINPVKSSYQLGDSISLAAVPVEKNRFVGWSGKISSNSPSIQIIVDGHVNLDARFQVEDLGFGRNLRISSGVRVFWQTDVVGNEAKALMAVPDEGTKSYWFEVDVEYSGIVSWDVVYETNYYTNSDKKELFIDGKLEEGFSRWYNEDKFSFLAGIDPGRSVLRWKGSNSYLYGTTAFTMILENIGYEKYADNSYETWMKSLNLDPIVNGDPGDDPNKDRIPNILHYAFNTDPLTPGKPGLSPLVAVTTIENKNYMTLTLPVHKDVYFFPDQFGHLLDWVHGKEIRIQSTTALSNFDLVTVKTLEPALIGNLEELPEEYEYRTFLANEPLVNEKGVFMRFYIDEAP